MCRSIKTLFTALFSWKNFPLQKNEESTRNNTISFVKKNSPMSSMKVTSSTTSTSSTCTTTTNCESKKRPSSSSKSNSNNDSENKNKKKKVPNAELLSKSIYYSYEKE